MFINVKKIKLKQDACKCQKIRPSKQEIRINTDTSSEVNYSCQRAGRGGAHDIKSCGL